MSSFLGSVGGAIGDFMGSLTGTSAAAEAQYNAQQQAHAEQQAQTLAAQQAMEAAAQSGQGTIQDYTGQAAGALGQGLLGAQSAYFRAGQDLQNNNLLAMRQGELGMAGARGALGPLLGLQGYGAGAAQSINPYDVTGSSALGGISPYDVTGQQSRLAQILGQSGSIGQQIGQPVDLESDPGFQFRRQQGEDAINRAASASGDRGGGATLKALADYNQGLASQEYGAAHQRGLAENQQRMGLLGQQMGAAGGVDRLTQAGLMNQAGRTDAAGMQAQQNQLAALMNQAGRSDTAALAAQRNQMGLAGMGFGAQGQLADLFRQQGQFGASQYNQLGANMANLFGQQAGAHQAHGSQLANLLSGAGTNMANIGIGAAGQGMNTAQQLNQQTQNFAQFGGMQEQARANATTQGLGLLMQGGSALFSDARLKQGIERIDGPFDGIGLPSYRWRWNDSALELGMWGKSNGVIAQDVQDLYPDAVSTHPSGYLMVDYGKLREIAEGQQ